MPRPKGQTLTPQDILDVAIILLEAQGVEGFSINQLAKALAIKPPSLYNHFDGDLDLRRSIRLTGWQKMTEYCLPDIQSNDHPVELIKRMANRYREFAIENPSLYLFTTQHPFPGSDHEFNILMQKTLDIYLTMLIPFGLGKDKIMHTVRLLHAAIHGFLVNELLGMFTGKEPTSDSFEWMIHHLVGSLLPPQNGET
jgi:AcrR family transcriptional regulator